MNPLWQLPTSTVLAGKTYPIHADFRDILEIFSYLDDPDLAEFVRWRIGVGLFYEGEVPEEVLSEAIEYLIEFISCGQPEQKPGPKLLDWETDAMTIISDVNKVAGQEIRSLPFVHWWTFMAWFHGIGEGQLSTLVGIREKLHRGKKLEKWEQEFYRNNKKMVDLARRYTEEEQEEIDRLNKMLG